MTRKSDAALLSALSLRVDTQKQAANIAATPFGMLDGESRGAVPIPIDQIDPSPYQSRVLNSEHVDALAEMIKQQGLISHIVVRSLPSGRYELVAGHHRVEAFRRLGRAEIPAAVRQMTDREAAIALTADNTLHAELTDWQRYRHIKMLRERGFESGATELARILGCARAQVYRYDAFGALPEQVQLMLDADPTLIGGNLAYDLQKFAGEHSALVTEAAMLLKAEKLKQAGCVGWIQRRLTARAVPERHEFQLQLGDTRIRMVSAPGETKISGNLDAHRLHKLIEANLAALIRVDDEEAL